MRRLVRRWALAGSWAAHTSKMRYDSGPGIRRTERGNKNSSSVGRGARVLRWKGGRAASSGRDAVPAGVGRDKREAARPEKGVVKSSWGKATRRPTPVRKAAEGGGKRMNVSKGRARENRREVWSGTGCADMYGAVQGPWGAGELGAWEPPWRAARATGWRAGGRGKDEPATATLSEGGAERVAGEPGGVVEGVPGSKDGAGRGGDGVERVAMVGTDETTRRAGVAGLLDGVSRGLGALAASLGRTPSAVQEQPVTPPRRVHMQRSQRVWGVVDRAFPFSGGWATGQASKPLGSRQSTGRRCRVADGEPR